MPFSRSVWWAVRHSTALFDGRHILIVDADQAEGKAIGVTGTPTYVTPELLQYSSGVQQPPRPQPTVRSRL